VSDDRGADLSLRDGLVVRTDSRSAALVSDAPECLVGLAALLPTVQQAQGPAAYSTFEQP
jgi:hypothetical protein